MIDTLSISLQGLQSAELRFERAARNIAGGHSPASESGVADDDSFQLSTPQDKPVDYVRELLAVIESKTAAKANLKVMAMQRELDKSTLDLMA